MAVEAAKAHSFTVWMQNTNRQLINITGSPSIAAGDEIVADGLLYSTPTLDGPPIGRQDFVAVVTSVQSATERRHISIELDFTDGAWAQKHLGLREKAAGVTGVKTADGASGLQLVGVETWPSGGGILRDPLTLAIVGGTGAFFGARGQATISLLDAPTQKFKFVIVLA